MSRVNNNTVFQKCANFTYQPVHIRKGANLGKFICLSSADKIVPFDNAITKIKCDIDENSKFSPSQKVNIEQENISEAQHEELCTFIDEFPDVFVGPDNKLGKTDILEHEIKSWPSG